MNLFDDFVAVDIETSGLDNSKDEIIEIGAARFNSLRPIEEFSELINPFMPISDFITELTGITNVMLENDGRPADEVIDNFRDFIGDSPLVFHNGAFDISFLEKFISTIGASFLDTKIISRIYYPFARYHGLRSLAEMFSIENKNTHRALSDALVTGEIMVKLVALQKYLPLHLKDKLALFCSVWGNKAMAEFFSGEFSLPQQKEFEINLIPPGKIPKSNILSGEADKKTTIGELKILFGADGVLAKDLDNYEYRLGQAEMAQDCLDVFGRDNFLLVEAGTGTGKSFSYLFPSMMTALERGKVFISTKTKNLQKQLFEKDIPFALKYFPSDLKVSLLKGRGNYLCLLKLYNLSISTGIISPQEVPRILPLLSFAEYSRTGDFSEITSEFSGNFSFYSHRFSVSDGFCTGNKCPFFKKCFLFKARKKAKGSSVVIVNHYLFFADLSSGADILTDFKIGVFDEAHQLDNVARDYLGLEFSPSILNPILEFLSGERIDGIDVLSVLRNKISKNVIMDRDIEDIEIKVDGIKSLAKTISRSLRNAFEGISIKAARSGAGRKRKRNDNGIKIRYRYGDEFQAHIQETLEPLSKQIQLLYKALSDLVKIAYDKCGEDISEIEDVLEIINQNAENIKQAYEHLWELALGEDNKWVYWFETGRGRSRFGILKASPVNIGELVYNTVYSKLKSAVFTSATLKSNDDFENIEFKIGLNLVDSERVVEKYYPSPFDFKNLLRVLALKFMPHPDESNYALASAEIFELFANTLRKNMMALTTSYSQLESLYQLISARLKSLGYNVIAQGINGNAETVAKSFSESTKPTLLIGTDSFWEGVDFPGEKLEVLFILRLPFAVPTEPITQAVSEYFQSLGMDAFKDYSLPEAIIKFRQGCGRLIRSSTDRGIVVILDNRISTKYYGRFFMKALPVKSIIMENYNDLEALLFGVSIDDT